jgi:molybdopterin-synthase adenylyltransferase
MMAKSSRDLPWGKLGEEVHFASLRSTWHEIEQRLRENAPNEACVFVLAYPSCGSTRKTLILREPVWPVAGEVRATPYNLDISPDYISRVLDRAIDAGELTGVVMIHTHPDTEYGKGEAFFSRRDDWYETRLFPTITLQRSKAISGSIVLGSGLSDIDGRVWWNNGSGILVQFAEIIRLVGPEIKFIETKHSRWKDHPDPTIMDRSTRLWGADGRRRLQNIRVGIVGVGGTGSIALLSLATMGVGKIKIWDADVIKSENLHRMIGSTKDMVGQNKAEMLAAVAKAAATANPFEIDSSVHVGTSNEGLCGLKDCDLIFCCVDKFAPRVPLNDLAYAHLIPTIDVASWIHQSKGMVDAIMTHAHVWSPDIPCAWCRQTLTSMRLMREAQGNQRNAENRIPYGLSLDQTDGVEPSVLPLNLTGIGLALMEFMQVALNITKRTPRDLKLFLPEWELDESDLNTSLDCGTESDTGLGDVVRINPVSS